MSPEFQQAMDCIGRVEIASGLDDLCDQLAVTFENFGVSNFTMLGMMAGGDSDVRGPRLLLERANRDWVDHYLERKHYNVDPTVHTSLRKPGAFSWADIESGRLSKEVRALFAEARDAMEIDGGLVIPVHDEDGCAGLAALYHEDRELTPKVRQALKLISIVAIERAKELHSLSEIGRMAARPACPLTPRQREILALVASGKSDWDIGVILSIASSTVNEHVEKAKDALGVKTRAQAVALAVRNGWVVI